MPAGVVVVSVAFVDGFLGAGGSGTVTGSGVVTGSWGRRSAARGSSAVGVGSLPPMKSDVIRAASRPMATMTTGSAVRTGTRGNPGRGSARARERRARRQRRAPGEGEDPGVRGAGSRRGRYRQRAGLLLGLEALLAVVLGVPVVVELLDVLVLVLLLGLDVGSQGLVAILLVRLVPLAGVLVALGGDPGQSRRRGGEHRHVLRLFDGGPVGLVSAVVELRGRDQREVHGVGLGVVGERPDRSGGRQRRDDDLRRRRVDLGARRMAVGELGPAEGLLDRATSLAAREVAGEPLAVVGSKRAGGAGGQQRRDERARLGSSRRVACARREAAAWFAPSTPLRGGSRSTSKLSGSTAARSGASCTAARNRANASAAARVAMSGAHTSVE